MRFVLILFVTLMIATAASAETGKAIFKNSIPFDPGTPDGREGGETINEPFEIVGLPFTDTGNTYDNLDDTDEGCPYMGSLSPDVVYIYSPTFGVEGITIDLCESGYDTKVYVYENGYTPGAPYACNDDYNCAISYRSRLPALPVQEGNSYLIVVDGYGNQGGDYTLNVNEVTQCELNCPAEGELEGEPPLVEGYVDSFNGGCNNEPYIFQLFDSPVLCATSGWYYNGGNRRDRDWFTVIADDNGIITASAYSELDLVLHVRLPVDCDSAGYPYDALCGCDISGTVEFAHPPGTEAWIVCSPTIHNAPHIEFDYILSIEGIEYSEPTPTEDSSWGKIKQKYFK
jgi:hypothetical protein